MPPAGSQRRVVVDGRLVNASSWSNARIYWRRSLVALLVLGVLWYTNPYNNPSIHPDAQRSRRIAAAASRATSRASLPTSWTTYGLFSIRERHRGDGWTMYALGQDVWTCWYDKYEPDILYSWRPKGSHKGTTKRMNLKDDLCRLWRDTLCHGRPLIWYPQDRAYTTHRIVILLLFVMTILRWCSNIDLVLDPSNVLSCFISLLLPASPWSLVEAYWFLYPAWERMNRLIPLQHLDSFFHFFGNRNDNDWSLLSTSADDANYVWSVLILLTLTATVVYTTQYYYNSNNHRALRPQSHLLVAAALGYIRGSYGSSERVQSSRSLSLLPTPWKLSTISATWTLLLIQLVTLSMTTNAAGKVLSRIIPWWISNTIGAILGEYQYQNQQFVVWVDSLWNGLRDSLRSWLIF